MHASKMTQTLKLFIFCQFPCRRHNGNKCLNCYEQIDDESLLLLFEAITIMIVNGNARIWNFKLDTFVGG